MPNLTAPLLCEGRLVSILKERWHREHRTTSSDTFGDDDPLLDDRVLMLSSLRLAFGWGLIAFGFDALAACDCSCNIDGAIRQQCLRLKV
jgi:hypothetical protein